MDDVDTLRNAQKQEAKQDGSTVCDHRKLTQPLARKHGFDGRQDKEKQKLIREYSDKLIEKALELEGTITGEHGIGLQKKGYLLKEHPDNLPVMKSIKRSMDPNSIMNPGKVFDLN